MDGRRSRSSASPARKPRSRQPRAAADAAPRIDPADIPAHVIDILQTLADAGFESMLVGGAVRDLLLGRHPKDFDIGTSARPEEVKALFRNARIIGRRFRLVLLRYAESQVEVATFRGPPRRRNDGMILRDNTFGTPHTDAVRRDFTINALMYDPLRGQLVDHVHGLPDLEAGIIRTIAPPRRSLREDPVRMLRALRFHVRLDFALDPELEGLLHRMAPDLAGVSRHRLAEETQRYLNSGLAQRMFSAFDHYGLLHPLLNMAPFTLFFDEDAQEHPRQTLQPYLACLDHWYARGEEPIPPTVALLGLLLTLCREECLGMFTGVHGRWDAGKERRMRAGLPRMLSDWGLLNGQVQPALQILNAARRIIRRGDPEKSPDSLGVREAWLLLAALQEVLGLDDEFVALGLQQRTHLPDLVILDHARPPGRSNVHRGHAPPSRGPRRPRAPARRPRTRR